MSSAVISFPPIVEGRLSAASLSSIPAQGSTRLILRHACLEEVLFLLEVEDFAHPRERVFDARVEGLEADLFAAARSEEHTSELQSLMRISYAVFSLNKKKTDNSKRPHNTEHILLQ